MFLAHHLLAVAVATVELAVGGGRLKLDVTELVAALETGVCTV